MMKNLLFLCGSLRKGSSSRALANALAQAVQGTCVSGFAEIDAIPHFNSDIEGGAAVKRLIDDIGGADGLVFVTPEYNYSIPGPLKNAIDWASRPAMQSCFRDKPAFVITVSAGATGGVRAQSHLKYVLNGMLARVHSAPEVIVPHAVQSVENGSFTNQGVLDFATASLTGFVETL